MVNAPTANTIAAAEHGIALIAALSRNVAQADASMKKGEWKRSTYTGVSLVGKTLSIMGFGKVCVTPIAQVSSQGNLHSGGTQSTHVLAHLCQAHGVTCPMKKARRVSRSAAADASHAARAVACCCSRQQCSDVDADSPAQSTACSCSCCVPPGGVIPREHLLTATVGCSFLSRLAARSLGEPWAWA